MKNANNTVLDCAEKMAQTIKRAAERIAEGFAEFYFQMAILNMTPAKRRKMKLQLRYLKRRMEMSNNERRRRGLPMVKRTKRQQWITYGKGRKKK